MIAAAGLSPSAYLLVRSNEQRRAFKSRRWMAPNGINPTTEHTVTTPRGQPPLVTSTSASCPLRDSGPPRPRSRVEGLEDTNGPPARRCSCKLRPTWRVGGESSMTQWISPTIRSGQWSVCLADSRELPRQVKRSVSPCYSESHTMVDRVTCA